MNRFFCNDSATRKCLAVAISFACAMLMALEAIHGNACAWMGLSAEQSYALSTVFATVTVFLGSFILAQMVANRPAQP